MTLFPWSWKTCANSLTTPLTHLLNTYLQNCSIPEEWKVHKIVPGSDPSDVHNYRFFAFLSKSWKQSSCMTKSSISFSHKFLPSNLVLRKQSCESAPPTTCYTVFPTIRRLLVCYPLDITDFNHSSVTPIISLWIYTCYVYAELQAPDTSECIMTTCLFSIQ